ncbi:c-type cytochrome [Mariprofundus ferrooxydans]|uniref:c-type cytochrome n=1 Tax=Mariprofundus ferrooxydans TaxID=314344 RepID=UPI00142F4751|nr:c-type cytochrome [Mariprofundus ferrooxydans]
MKIYPWIYSVVVAGALSACGNADDQRSMSPNALAAQKVAAIQQVMALAAEAREAVEAADSSKQQAVEYAQARQAAVRAAIAKAAKETELLKKDAESKARWAALTQARAAAARTALLQAALEQSKAEALVAEKIKAVQTARIQADIHQEIARKAMQEKIEAEMLSGKVMAAEKLAALSIGLKQQQAQTQANSDPVSASQPNQRPTETARVDSHPRVIAPSHRPHVIAKNNIKPATTAMHKDAKPATVTKLAMAKPAQPQTSAANAVRGHALAKKCQLCHTFDAGQKAKFGPGLFGIVGKQAGKTESYKYGQALAAATFTWDQSNLADWVCNSGRAIKQLTGKHSARTKMPAQHACGQDAQDIVAYLASLKAQPARLARAD